MPGMTGEELAAELRRDRPDLKVLCVRHTRDAIGIRDVFSAVLSSRNVQFCGTSTQASRCPRARQCRTPMLVDTNRQHGPAREALGSSGYEVDVVHTARELTDKVRLLEGRVDCVVLDDRSQQVDIARTISVLRSIAEHLPILVLSDDWERLKKLEDRCIAIAPTPDRTAEVTTLLRRLKVRCNNDHDSGT